MTKNRVIVIIALVLVLLGVRYQVALNRQTESDEQQIASLIQRGESGVERKNAREAMSIVSKDYKDSIGMTYRVMQIRVANALDSAENPDVTITQPVIRTNGDEGTMQFHVRVVDRRNDTNLFEHDMTLQLRKEKLHKYLIFTSHEWRVTSTQGLEGALGM